MNKPLIVVFFMGLMITLGFYIKDHQTQEKISNEKIITKESNILTLKIQVYRFSFFNKTNKIFALRHVITTNRGEFTQQMSQIPPAQSVTFTSPIKYQEKPMNNVYHSNNNAFYIYNKEGGLIGFIKP